MKVAAMIFALGTAVSGFAADSTYKGYLVDTYCGKAGSSKMDGSNVIDGPQDHTVACQIACAKGGYGVMVADGKKFKFVPFDAKGSELALQILKASKNEKAPAVVAMGTLKNGVIAVASLKEDVM
jgi:hypothetical protein